MHEVGIAISVDFRGVEVHAESIFEAILESVLMEDSRPLDEIVRGMSYVNGEVQQDLYADYSRIINGLYESARLAILGSQIPAFMDLPGVEYAYTRFYTSHTAVVTFQKW